MNYIKKSALLGLLLTSLFSGCSKPTSEQALTVYCGRSENLVAPLFKQFEEQSGITLAVRYGSTAEMAATILEEGSNSPADVYIAQDAGALGALAEENRLRPLPEPILTQVEKRFQSATGHWVGLSGRARTVVYNTRKLSEKELPQDLEAFTQPVWKNRIGWAPANGSFQSFVTAMRASLGDEKTRAWLKGIQANNPHVYPKNTPIVAATAAGEIDVGFVNHYYLYRFLAEQGDDFAARNAHIGFGGKQGLVNTAGAGILNTSKNLDDANALIQFLLSEQAQAYFANETHEYPLAQNISADPRLKPLAEIKTPDIDLSDLDDLKGTLSLLQETGIL